MSKIYKIWKKYAKLDLQLNSINLCSKAVRHNYNPYLKVSKLILLVSSQQSSKLRIKLVKIVSCSLDIK